MRAINGCGTGLRGVSACVLAGVAGSVLCAGSARGDLIQWLAATSGNWSNPGMWSGGDVPNSLNDVALITKAGPAYVVTVDFDVPMEALVLNSASATVNLNGSRWMYVAAVNPDSFCMIENGTFNVTGGATLKCDREIGLTGAGAKITLNNGALEGGEIVVNEGLVTLTGTGYIRTGVTSLMKAGANQVVAPDGVTLYIDRPEHVLAGPGNLYLGGSYYGTSLVLKGNLVNQGNIRTSNFTGNSIYAEPAADPDWTLSNFGSIEGSGALGGNFTTLFNDRFGVIAGTLPSAMTVDPGAGGMKNNGQLQARDGGTLNLGAGTYWTDDAGFATVLAMAGSTVNVNSGAVLVDQRLATAGNGVVNLAGCTLREGDYGGTRISGLARLLDGQQVTVSGYVDMTGGTLGMYSSYYGSTVNLEGDAYLGGPGTLTMSNHGGNLIAGSPVNVHTLTNFDAVVRGSGNLGANTIGLVNWADGRIEAEGSTGLVVNPSDVLGMRNEGLMRALAGGRLYLDGLGFDNTGGTIHAEDGGIVYLRGAGITGGELTATGNGYVMNSASNSVLTGVSSHAPLYIPDGVTTRFVGSLVNTGTLFMTSSYYGATFYVQGGDLTVGGGGTISLSNHGGNGIYAASGGMKFINLDNLITGSGQFGANQLTIVNQGTVRAAGSTGLTVNPDDTGGATNHGLMEAAAGGRLYLDGPGFKNAGGEIHAAETGIVYLRGAGVTGGVLTSEGSGEFLATVNNSVLRDVTNESTVRVVDGVVARVESTLVNRGVLNLASSYYGSTLVVQGGDVTLSGGGTVLLSNHGGNYVYGASGALRLINQDNVITGSGQLLTNQLGMVNQGTVRAAGSTGLVVNPDDSSAMANVGLMEATAGGRLYLDGPGFANAGGEIHAADTGIVYLRGAEVSGGRLTTAGSGAMIASANNSLLKDLTSEGLVRVLDGVLMKAQGGIVNQGMLALDSSYYGTTLVLAADLTLTGAGTVALSNHGGNYVYGANAGVKLTNNGNTIRGSGQLGNNQLVIVNGPGGVIAADQGTALTVNPSNTGGLTNMGTLRVSGAGTMLIGDGPFTTSGTVQVDAGRMLQRTSGEFVQTGGSSIADGEIQVDGDSFRLEGGVVGGVGRVDSNVVNSGGVAAPGSASGSSLGTLTIEGNYTQQSGGELAIEVGGKGAGQFDRLVVTGTTSLGGTLRLFNVNTFIAEPGDQVTVLTGTGTVSGVFSQVVQPVAGPRWGVSYVGKTVVLTAFCGADYDNTGFVDTDDFTAFVSAFEAGVDEADFDGSGFVDTDDFTAFVIAFEAGC